MARTPPCYVCARPAEAWRSLREGRMPLCKDHFDELMALSADDEPEFPPDEDTTLEFDLEGFP